jgi:methyl-accepting chemotaxis protein
MEDIVNQVKRVADLIAEISSATIEQTSGIGQVSDAVNQLDQVTQQNAALVEESAAAAESLKQQASRLADVVSVFKLGQDASQLAIARA